LAATQQAAALEALQRWAAGESAAAVAANRPKPIQVGTVLGYLADCAGSGHDVDATRLAGDAGLDPSLAAKVGFARTSGQGNLLFVFVDMLPGCHAHAHTECWHAWQTCQQWQHTWCCCTRVLCACGGGESLLSG
jgi:hypothetical protein